MKLHTKILIWVLAAMVIAAGIFVVSCKKSSTAPKESNSWTVIMYGAGNNNLDGANNNTSYIIQDVQDMEKVGSQSNMNIIAMVASVRTGGGAKYYKIEHHPSENPDQISSTMLENKGSKDMSDPATMIEFLNYVKAHYSAQHYLLVVDDHGAGWPGTCSDDLGGAGSLLTMPELKNAISNSDIHHVDLVVFHACLMAMAEVAYELKDVADYMTGSQFSMPMENVLAADLWLDWLKNNLGTSTDQLGRQIAQFVIQRAEYKQKTTCYALLKTSAMANLGSKVGTFSNVLSTEGAQHWNEVVDAWAHTNTTALDDPKYCDLRQFASLIKGEPDFQQSTLITASADSVITAINGAVPFTNSYFKPGDAPVTRGGMNIHFPRSLQEFDSVNYVGLGFHATNWQSFLSNFVRSAGGGGEPQGKCCYTTNGQLTCAVGTQAQCNGVAGQWTQGVDCSGANPCGGGGDPTGRCCYQQNGQPACGVGTQAQCNAVAGQWTQGADCSGNPCGGGGGSCPTTCAAATPLTLGQVVNCSFQGADSVNWFALTVTQNVAYRFQLCGFTNPVDYDFYLLASCTSAPFAGSERVGCEDTTWTFNGSGTIALLVHRYSGSGAYQLLVSQAGPNAIENPIDPREQMILTNSKAKRLDFISHR